MNTNCISSEEYKGLKKEEKRKVGTYHRLDEVARFYDTKSGEFIFCYVATGGEKKELYRITDDDPQFIGEIAVNQMEFRSDCQKFPVLKSKRNFFKVMNKLGFTLALGEFNDEYDSKGNRMVKLKYFSDAFHTNYYEYKILSKDPRYAGLNQEEYYHKDVLMEWLKQENSIRRKEKLKNDYERIKRELQSIKEKKKKLANEIENVDTILQNLAVVEEAMPAEMRVLSRTYKKNL